MQSLTPDDIRNRAFARKSIRLGIVAWTMLPLAAAVVILGLIASPIQIGPSGLVVMLVATLLALFSTIAIAVVQLSSRRARRLPHLGRREASRLARGQRAPRGSWLPDMLVWLGVAVALGAMVGGLWLIPVTAQLIFVLAVVGMAAILLPVATIVGLSIAAGLVIKPLTRADFVAAREALDRSRWWIAGGWHALHEGTLQTALGEFDQAEGTLRGWLGRWRRGPLLPFVLENLAWALIGAERWEDAEEVLAALIDVDPTRGATFAQLAVLDLQRGTADERTVEWLELALELNLRGPLQERPRTEDIRAALAWGQASIGRAVEARRQLEQVDLESRSLLTIAGRCLRIGRGWLALGDTDKADAMFDRVMELGGEAEVAKRARGLRTPG